MAKSTLASIRQAVTADMVSRLRNGNIMIRKGYFYRGKQDEYAVARSITQQLELHDIAVKVVKCGDHWASFKGGKGVKNNSHFYVEIAVLD